MNFYKGSEEHLGAAWSFRGQFWVRKKIELGLNRTLRQPFAAISSRIVSPGSPRASGHAHGHLEYLEAVGDPATGEPIGSTELNLKAAIAGETHEYSDMYPGMAKSAREEGFDEIADWFETLAKAERSHANRFQKALDSMD